MTQFLLFLIFISIPSNSPQKPSHSPSHASQGTPHSTHYVSFAQLGHARAKSTGDTGDGVIGAFANISDHAA